MANTPAKTTGETFYYYVVYMAADYLSKRMGSNYYLLFDELRGPILVKLCKKHGCGGMGRIGRLMVRPKNLVEWATKQQWVHKLIPDWITRTIVKRKA